jgi:hypothetical protein
MPLVPPAADAVAEVGDVASKGLSVTKDMTQPAPAGQLMGETVTGLPVTLKNIRSLELLNSVTGEQVDKAVVSVGPSAIVVLSITPASTAMTHSELTVTPVTVCVPHAYIHPELVPPE